MEAPRGLGIVGWTPRRGGLALPPVVMVRRLSDFQRLAGELAEHLDRWPAGHAVAHASAAGATPIVFGRVDAPPTADGGCACDEVAAAVGRVLATGVVGALVIPGLLAPDALAAAAAAALGAEVPLWADSPRDVAGEALIAYAAGLPPGARLAAPWVRSHTPGALRAVVLPPSCVAGTLSLASALKGSVTPEPALAAEDVRRLVAAGGGALVSSGPRGALALDWSPLAAPLPRAHEAADAPGAAQAPRDPSDPIAAALDDALASLLDGGPNGPALWRRLERAAAGVLDGFVARGVLSGYVVRCDAETNLAAGPDADAPVVEVVVTTPRRVREIVVNLTPR